MELNKEMFIKLFDTNFNASYAEASRQLGVASAQIFRIINSNGEAGAKFLGKLITYCDTHKLNFRNYIFLPKPLTTVNKKTNYKKSSLF